MLRAMEHFEPENTDAAQTAASGALRSEAWERVRRRLRAELGEDVFSSWFGRLELTDVVDGVAHLSVPTRFLKSWIQSHYMDRVCSLLTAECEGVGSIELTVRNAGVRSLPPKPANSDTPPAAVNGAARGLSERAPHLSLASVSTRSLRRPPRPTACRARPSTGG